MLLYCSFCDKSHEEVKKLIASTGVYICDECIGVCNEILSESLGAGNENAPQSGQTNQKQEIKNLILSAKAVLAGVNMHTLAALQEAVNDMDMVSEAAADLIEFPKRGNPSPRTS